VVQGDEGSGKGVMGLGGRREGSAITGGLNGLCTGDEG